MINNRLAALCVSAFVLMLAPAVGHSAEELFDTKAATQHTEKGIAHLKARNYDAALGVRRILRDLSRCGGVLLTGLCLLYERQDQQRRREQKKIHGKFRQGLRVEPEFHPDPVQA